MIKKPKQEIIQAPHNFKPRDYQLRLFQKMDSGIKRAFLRWHRRAGKDKACYAYMAKEATRKVGAYYYFFPTYKQGRMALWEGIDKDGFKVLNHLHPSLIKRQSNQEMSLELTNGSIIRIVGTDDIDKIVGTNPVGCVFSEYSLQLPIAWTLMSPILAENGGWAIFNGTPRGRNHMYKLEMAMAGSPNWYIDGLDVEQSGLYDSIKEKIGEDRKMHGDDYVDQEYYVKYSAGVKGAIFMDYIEKARKDKRIGTYIYDPNLCVDTFWDLGVGDSTSIWFRQVRGNQINWIDYFECSGKDLRFYVDILKNKCYNYRTHYLPHDGNNRSILTTNTPREVLSARLKEMGVSGDSVTVRKFNSKQDAIQTTRSRMGRMCWNEGTTEEGIEKLSLYHYRWDSKREVFLKEPVHDGTSHCADALMTEAAAERFDDRDNPFYESMSATQGAITDYDPYSC